jgi:hypothetical protein
LFQIGPLSILDAKNLVPWNLQISTWLGLQDGLCYNAHEFITNYVTKVLRASPAVMSILSLYVHYSTTLFIFSDTLSSSTLYSLFTLFKYIFFILLSHLNIIFLIHSLLLFTSNNYLYNPAITQILPTHRHHHHHHKPNTTPSPATTNQQKLHHNYSTTASQDPTVTKSTAVTKSTTVRRLNPQPS